MDIQNTSLQYRFRIESARGNTTITTRWSIKKITREDLNDWVEDFPDATVTAEYRVLVPLAPKTLDL